MKAFINLLTCFLLMISCQLNAQKNQSNSETEKLKNDFKKFINKKMKSEKVVGLSVALLIDNELVLDEGFGFSDKSNGVRASKNTKYPIGSVSKIVTSTAILKLYSDGIIDIDKPYTDYVKDFSMKSHFSSSNSFTIRHLLAHYAGIPRLRVKGFMKKKPVALEDILINSKDDYLIAPPGKVYQYSDWGVDLLSLLVERVTKTKYEEYVVNNIFKPLGMTHSNFGPTKSTKGYIDGKEVKTYDYSFSGSDGVLSTASDMLKLTQLYINDPKISGSSFLKPDIIKEALTKQYVDATLAYDRGIGLMWNLTELSNGDTRVAKGGIHEPYYTYILFLKDFKSAIVICSNSNSSSSIHSKIWGKLYSHLGKKNNFKNSHFPLRKRKKLKKVTLTNEEFQKLEGTYSTNEGILNFKRNGKKFDVTLGGQKGLGIPYSNNLIKLYVKKLGMKFHAMDVFWNDVNGEIVVGEQRESGNRFIFGSKIVEQPIPSTWKAAVGTYVVSNYDENDYKTFNKIKLFINSKGILEINGKVEYPSIIKFQLGLSTISDEMAIIPGYNFDFFGGETVKLKKINNKFILTLSGYNFEKLN